MKKFLLVISIIALIPLIVLLSLIILLKSNYSRWEKDFESQMVQEYVISSSNREGLGIEKKILEFTLSNSNTETLELSVSEVGALVFSTIENNLDGNIKVTDIYIEPSNSKWNVYSKLNYKKQHIWISVDINKDSMQTAQLYITDIHIGPYSISRYYDFVGMINSGIANALLTVNENGFTGRYLENIELMERGIVVKGSRY